MEIQLTGTFNATTGAITIAGTVTPGSPSEPTPASGTISKTESFVGQYADIDGNGSIDGIIYVDLLAQAGTSGQWGDEDGAYTIPSTVTSSNVKDYVVGASGQTDARWSSTETKDVIKLASSSTGTNDRFYVMGLDDITDGTNDTLYWYYNAYGNMSDYSTYTSGNFETGKANTTAMMTKWTGSGYGDQNPRDLWGNISTEVSKGWFVPSRAEWGAFGENLGITSSNYVDYNLSNYYWSSSQYDSDSAWGACFGNGCMDGRIVDGSSYVRVSATF